MFSDILGALELAFLALYRPDRNARGRTTGETIRNAVQTAKKSKKNIALWIGDFHRMGCVIRDFIGLQKAGIFAPACGWM